MATRYRTVISVIVVALGVILLGNHIHYRNAKDRVPNDSRTAVVIAPLDENSKAFLVEQRTNWVYVDNLTAGRLTDALTELMKAAGLVPSIQNLTNVLTSPTDRRLWLSPSAKRDSLLVDAVKTIVEGLGYGTLRVTEDGRLALLWMDTNTVIVFKDGTNGMGGSRYDRKLDKAEAVRDAIDQLQGEWLLVSGFVGDQPATAARQIYKSNVVTTIRPGRPDIKETIIIDPTKPAKAIDFEMIDRSGETRKRLGIYSLGNGRLLLEVADSGGERPKHFFDGGKMSEWRRERE